MGTGKNLGPKGTRRVQRACQDFVRKVSPLDGVIAIGAIPYADYVDLWTVTDRNDRGLDRAIIKHFIEVVRRSNLGLLFDFMITSEEGTSPRRGNCTLKGEVDAEPRSTRSVGMRLPTVGRSVGGVI